MNSYDESVEINHNLNRYYIPDHPYRNLIIGGRESDKTTVLVSLIRHQQPNPFESQYQLFINKDLG